MAICLDELRKAWLKRSESLPAREPSASFAAQDRTCAHLQTALESVHFLWDENADRLMHALRHLIGRAQPSPMEVDLLHGLARQLLWIARQPRNQGEQTPPGAS
jgi:tRNA C32,U32 (ribose-2'-O)-methylase TrmJ